jgi:hypothetical protein
MQMREKIGNREKLYKYYLFVENKRAVFYLVAPGNKLIDFRKDFHYEPILNCRIVGSGIFSPAG